VKTPAFVFVDISWKNDRIYTNISVSVAERIPIIVV